MHRAADIPSSVCVSFHNGTLELNLVKSLQLISVRRIYRKSLFPTCEGLETFQIVPSSALFSIIIEMLGKTFFFLLLTLILMFSFPS